MNMIYGNNYLIRKANLGDITGLKKLVDQHRYQLGFVLRASLESSIERSELLVAVDPENTVIGLVQYRHRKDGQTTLYNIVVSPEHQNNGIGRNLVDALNFEAKEHKQKQILLRCPFDLPSNQFYSAYGFIHIATEDGKKRPLQIWSYEVR